MISKRLDLKVGLGCNNNCRFCVQASKRDIADKTTIKIKEELNDASKRCSGVVFTGGEPTIRPDIFEIVSHARNLGFKVIQIQSNGRMFAYNNFCKKIINAGATEFSPALHGHIEELHDFLTGSKGSFLQTVSGIRNLKSMNQEVITNTVVVKPNYMHLPEIAKLLVSLKVDQFQFAFVHALGNAEKNFASIVPRMSLASPFIKRGLQIGIDAGKNVMVEAVPYCIMDGYEDYVSERVIPFTEIKDMNCSTLDYEKIRLSYGKKKFPQCKNCIHDHICEGSWREYPQKFGSSEFVPVEG